MDLVFNDLSTFPIAENLSEAGKRLYQYFDVVRKLQEHGFKRVRYVDFFENIMLTPEYSFLSFCEIKKSPSLRTLANWLLGMARHPFIDDDSEEESRYIQNKFYINKCGETIEAVALGTAYLYDTIAVNLNSEEYWRDLVYDLIIKGNEEKKSQILAICSVGQCDDSRFVDWKETRNPIELEICHTNPEDKRIKLRDDHGNDVLTAFAKRLCKSRYVKAIFNSLPYNDHEREFIRNVTPDGLIEIVLFHTDEGFGLVVKTTGRNLRETQLIAEILKNEYA